MKKTDKKPTAERKQPLAAENVSETTLEFTLDEFKLDSISSAETIKNEKFSETEALTTISKLSSDEPEIDLNFEKTDVSKIENPVFRELAEPKMPALRRENRARLQIQSPTRLHFYWSCKDNPFETLHRTLGANAKNYRFVVKLLNRKTEREEIVPVEAGGSWWFDADADSSYRAEVGFYAARRPFVRLMLSNSVETPRRNPSARPASDADWSVSADTFAQVLDNSGFRRDAFEVALAGDDAERAETATHAAFAHFFGDAENDFATDASSEMRFALLAVAAGHSLENLREQISPTLFAKLQSNAENLSAEKAVNALRKNFGGFENEEAEESLDSTVFGASSINFSRTSKRRLSPKFNPVSSSRIVRN